MALKILDGFALPRMICVSLLMLTACSDLFNFEGPIEHKYHREAGIAGMNVEMLEQASKYAGGSGIVMRGGRIIFQWGSIQKRYDLKSTTKSIGVTGLGLALDDGIIKLSDYVSKYYPEFGTLPAENRNNSWIKKITFLHLASQTAGFDKPGGFEKLLYEPGTAWAYSDCGPNWLADALTHLYKKDLYILLFERIFAPLGITREDLSWRENNYRDKKLGDVPRREFGSGIRANVKAMARIGEFFLREGNWNGKQLISSEFVNSISSPVSTHVNLPVKNDTLSHYAGAPGHYGLLWWNNRDRAMQKVPKDTYWSWGLFESIIAVIPSMDLVIARAGDSFDGSRSPSSYKILEPFFEPIVSSVNNGSSAPNSPVVAAMYWDDAASIIRLSTGSDNWPITWAEDDFLYTAYGDGFGFEPKVEDKLSLGFAKIDGVPPNISGFNVRSKDEQLGDGKSGKKASGMLMVNEVLFMWIRNVNRQGQGSQLAWSHDKGKNWQWSEWIFNQFGYCTFINYGRNHSGASDDFVYVVSHDQPSAYKRSDAFVMMRVPKYQIKNRNAYEFFVKLDSDNKPHWSSNISRRGAVFHHSAKCHRSGMSYNQGIKRYIWWQAKYPKGSDGRFVGSFGIFDAPEPWGPWTTVYYTHNWDAGAGETGSFPTKWMSEDGKSMYLVFSGNDAFSVRKATLVLSPDAATNLKNVANGSLR